MTCGIYLITHIATGLKYVGQSRQIEKRWHHHATYESRTRLGRAISKHGWESFRTEVLQECEIQHLNSLEASWIRRHDCLSPRGLNLTTGGDCFELSQETKAKIIAFHTGRKRTAESCARIGAAKLGMRHSEDSKRRMSESQMGRIVSAETREKLRSIGTGRAHTPEAKAKMTLSRLGKKLPPETRAKMSAYRTGRTTSTETASKISAALLGRVITADARAKISDKLKGNKLSPETIAKRTATQAAKRAARGGPTAQQLAGYEIARAKTTGKIVSPETGAKISASKKAAFARRRLEADLLAV